METRGGGEGSRRWRVAVLSASAIAAVVCGCQAILGMDGHDAYLATPAGDAGAHADAAPAASPCLLPSSGDATLRVGNLVPTGARVDVCLSRAQSPSPIDGKPVLAAAKGSCPAGLGYKDVVAPFKVQSGTYAVSIVPAGSACTAAPLATTSVPITASSGIGVYLLGDGASAPTTLTLTESTPTSEDSDLRVVNAVAGGGPLDFGFTSSAKLPATFETVVFPAVAFGQRGAGTTSPVGPIDAQGYMEIALPGGSLPFGAAPAGTTAVTLDGAPTLVRSESFTAFAIGRAGDPTYPEELYVCDEMEAESSAPLTTCAGGFTDVVVDVFDTYLWGPFAPFYPLRYRTAPAILATVPADVLCLTDVFTPGLITAITGATSAAFPYSKHFDDTLATPINAPDLADGGAPPSPTVPPCAYYDGKLEPLLACIDAYCTTQLGDEDASIIQDPTACITANCTQQAEALILAAPVAQLACWSCALFQLESGESIAETRSECTTDVNAGYAFGGQSGTLVLSRFPIGDAQQWVLPSTDWRSTIIRAPLTLPNKSELDAYCLILSDPLSSVTTPYTGVYGNGKTDITGWLAELQLQAQQVVTFVSQNSAGVPAVVAGDFFAGPAAPGGTIPLNSAAYQVLTSAFALAAPPSGPPGCSFCDSNPITSPPGSTPTGQSTLGQSVLLWNIPVTDVLSASFDLQANVLDAGTDDAGAYEIPPSPFYAYHAHVRVRP